MSPISRYLPRKRTILGGTLAVGLVAGIYLSTKLPHMGSGIGLGTGGDSVIGHPDTSRVAVNAGDPKSKSQSPPDDHGDGEQSVAKSVTLRRPSVAPPDDVLTILVEDEHYAVWRKTRKGNGYFPSELDDIVQLALKAKPNSDGVRVRIVRHKNARLVPWKTLQEELIQAGVPAESILLPKELIE
jgi:hypothetical protein